MSDSSSPPPTPPKKNQFVTIKTVLTGLCCCLLMVSVVFTSLTSYQLAHTYQTVTNSLQIDIPDKTQLYNIDFDTLTFTSGGQLSVISDFTDDPTTIISLRPSLVNTDLTTNSLWTITNMNMSTLSSSEIYCTGNIITTGTVTIQVDPKLPNFNLPLATSLTTNTISAITWPGTSNNLTFGPILKGFQASCYGRIAQRTASSPVWLPVGQSQILLGIDNRGGINIFTESHNVTFTTVQIGSPSHSYYSSMNLSQLGMYVITLTIFSGIPAGNSTLYYLSTTTNPYIIGSNLYNQVGTTKVSFLFAMTEFERGNLMLNYLTSVGGAPSGGVSIEAISLF